MAKSKKRTATRNKSSSKRKKAGAKRTTRMAAKRAPAKRMKAKVRRTRQNAVAVEPVAENRRAPAPVETAEMVVMVETMTVTAVEQAAPDPVVLQKDSIPSPSFEDGLEQGAAGQAPP